GTIPDRGYFALRLQESMAKIGELDEEFVWERSIGDTFTLGTQGWRIRKITHNDVLVAPARGATAMAPFWRADVQDRDFHFSEKVAQFLALADRKLGEPGFVEGLKDDYHLEPAAAAELVSFLKAQKSATGGRLPHRHHLLVEHVRDLARDDDRRQVILHTFWGGRVNRPLAIALRAAWEERYPDPIEVLHDDDSILLLLPSAFEADELLSLVDPEHLEELLRHRLEETGFFGARFRVNASTALLLPKSGFRHRMPLWLNRMRSKKLLAAVSRYEDFPILVETWRTCLVDEFDLDRLKQLLQEVRDGKIALSEVVTESPSPFAAGLIWQQTNQFMYDDDTPESAGASNLRQDLLRELVFSSQLRPRLPPALVEQFRRKVQRTSPGYAPRDVDELREWIAERLLLPQGEWRELVAAVERDGGEPQEELLRGLEDRVLTVTLPGASDASICALDRLPRILRALALAPGEVALGGLVDPQRPPPQEARKGLETLWAKASPAAEADSVDEAPADPLADVVGEWLRFYGPLAPERLRRLFGLDADRLREVLALLQESQGVVIDQLTRGAPDSPDTQLEICDVENLEILLRWLRRESRPSFEALGAEFLPLFLAIHHGLVRRGECLEDLRERLDQLLGYPLPAAAWEAEILPARLSPYYPSWLDSLMQETDLLWFGCGKARLSFAFPADLELFQGHDDGEAEHSGSASARIFPRDRGKFELAELAEHTGRSTAELTPELWQLAWEGRISNDSFVTVRKGVESKFQPVALPAPRAPRRRPGRRGAFDRWQATRPFFGSWFVLERESIPPDALEEEELVKDRLRVLLQRYGVLFRELVARELPLMQWSRLFRTLRLMELSGEILAGHFFEGVRGLQFISHSAYRELERGLPEDGIYWMNALDPASLCGIEIEGLKAELPARQASTHLVFHGPRLVMVSRRRGRELDFRVDAEHPHLPEYLEVLKVLLTREFQPLKFIDVEKINGEPAPRSPYCAKLGEVFRTVREQRSVKLWKHY
ncbi:MAG: ATP-dependent helicase, partial [bacterium]|nr:ATP-dependent helicase [bacterium]